MSGGHCISTRRSLVMDIQRFGWTNAIFPFPLFDAVALISIPLFHLHFRRHLLFNILWARVHDGPEECWSFGVLRSNVVAHYIGCWLH